jgi:outer membrane protein TolC
VLAGTSAAAAGDVKELSLEEALAMARKTNHSLEADRARLAQAQTNVSSAWATLLPTIAAQGRYTRNYAEFVFGAPTQPGLPGGEILLQPVNQLDGVVSFSAPLLVPAAYPGLKSVKAGVQATEANVEVNETDILFAVAQTFHAAGVADEVLQARASNIGVARATLDNAKTRFAAGTVTKVDVDRAELALVRAEQAEREARQGRDQTYRTLGTLIQINVPFRVAVPPLAIAPPPTEGSLDNILQIRPEFRATQFTIEQADQARKTDALKWSPSLSAFGNVRRFNYDNFRRDHYSWAVGLQLDWVIFDGGARDAQRHQAAAQVVEAEARSAMLKDKIRDDLANGTSLLETKQRAVEASTRSVALARETIDLVRTQYEAGAVTQVDLLQAQDGLVGAEMALAQAHYDLAVADLTLRRTAGTFPPR